MRKQTQLARPERLPEVGEGATLQVGSDCYPYTVVRVSATGKIVTLRADDYTCTFNNGGEGQEYKYIPNPEGHLRVAHWSPSRKRWTVGGAPVSIGHRRAYRDPSF